MKRLPNYDKNTGWLELSAYLALGLAGACLTGISFFDGSKSVGESNTSAGPGSKLPIEMVNETPGKELPVHLTNVIFLQSPASAGQAPPARTVAAPQG